MKHEHYVPPRCPNLLNYRYNTTIEWCELVTPKAGLGRQISLLPAGPSRAAVSLLRPISITFHRFC